MAEITNKRSIIISNAECDIYQTKMYACTYDGTFALSCKIVIFSLKSLEMHVCTYFNEAIH